MFRILLVILAGLGLAACSSGNFAGSHRMSSTFDASEAEYIFTVGRGAILGKAFVKSADGKVHNAAGALVILVPATRYAQERIATIYRGRSSADKPVDTPNLDRRYTYFTRRTNASKNGSFKFVDIADGDYFVTLTVEWRGKARSLVKRVKVTNSAKVNVVLSDKV
jgi:hypothetical protein